MCVCAWMGGQRGIPPSSKSREADRPTPGVRGRSRSIRSSRYVVRGGTPPLGGVPPERSSVSGVYGGFAPAYSSVNWCREAIEPLERFYQPARHLVRSCAGGRARSALGFARSARWGSSPMQSKIEVEAGRAGPMSQAIWCSKQVVGPGQGRREAVAFKWRKQLFLGVKLGVIWANNVHIFTYCRGVL